MKDETRNRRRDLLLALPASLVLHALIIALLVYDLPRPPQLQQEEQAINVTLVPPTAQPKSKPAPPVEKPPAPKVAQLPAPENQPIKPARIEVLKPVFQFGDKDTGPTTLLPGNVGFSTSAALGRLASRHASAMPSSGSRYSPAFPC